MNTTLTPADLDPRRQAMLLYFQGYRVAALLKCWARKLQLSQLEKTRQVGVTMGRWNQMQLTTAARYMPAHYEGAQRRERFQRD